MTWIDFCLCIKRLKTLAAHKSIWTIQLLDSSFDQETQLRYLPLKHLMSRGQLTFSCGITLFKRHCFTDWNRNTVLATEEQKTRVLLARLMWLLSVTWN